MNIERLFIDEIKHWFKQFFHSQVFLYSQTCFTDHFCIRIPK